MFNVVGKRQYRPATACKNYLFPVQIGNLPFSIELPDPFCYVNPSRVASYSCEAKIHSKDPGCHIDSRNCNLKLSSLIFSCQQNFHFSVKAGFGGEFCMWLSPSWSGCPLDINTNVRLQGTLPLFMFCVFFRIATFACRTDLNCK